VNWKIIFAAFLCLLLPVSGHAQTIEEAKAFYNAGQFEKAAETGRAAGGLEGLRFAVHSNVILVQYILPQDKRLEALEAAITEAQKIREKYPDDIELMISTGILVGLRGRYHQSVSDGKEARALFEMALAKDPEQPWALGALGSWHAETVYEAGGIAARLVMGAKKKFAWDYFDKSHEIDPNNIPITAAFIRALLKLKPKQYAGLLLSMIESVKKAKVTNALDRILQEQIKRIDAARLAGNEEELETLLDETVSYDYLFKNDA